MQKQNIKGNGPKISASQLNKNYCKKSSSRRELHSKGDEGIRRKEWDLTKLAEEIKIEEWMVDPTTATKIAG